MLSANGSGDRRTAGAAAAAAAAAAIASDCESDDGEEGDYTVYECPGLAPVNYFFFKFRNCKSLDFEQYNVFI